MGENTEAYFETVTENGNRLYVTVKLYIYQDENLNGSLFWTYNILNIKGSVNHRGETYDFEVDEDIYDEEITAACEAELKHFKEAA